MLWVHQRRKAVPTRTSIKEGKQYLLEPTRTDDEILLIYPAPTPSTTLRSKKDTLPAQEVYTFVTITFFTVNPPFCPNSRMKTRKWVSFEILHFYLFLVIFLIGVRHRCVLADKNMPCLYFVLSQVLFISCWHKNVEKSSKKYLFQPAAVCLKQGTAGATGKLALVLPQWYTVVVGGSWESRALQYADF